MRFQTLFPRATPVSFDLRMAWREIRPSLKRFLFMIAAVAVGVGALTGIKGFSEALDHAMSRSARDLIAADLSIRMNSAPSAEEEQALEKLVQLGAVMTRVTETLSMASSEKGQTPLLANVKAVDPKFYPFYGSLELEPAGTSLAALTDASAFVTQEFLLRVGVSIGETIRIGSGQFRIAAVLKSEPDRISSGVDLGPRVIITRKGLERSRLIQFGSRASESFLYRLPAKGLQLQTAREILVSGIHRPVRIQDYRDPNPAVSQGLRRMANFLSLIGLLALLVGGLGIATTIHTYLQQKLDSIAILKCLGGRSTQIIRIYLLQGLFIGVLGSVVGVGLGYVVQLLFPPLLRGLLELPTELELAPGAAAQGFLIGIITTLLFLLPPLLAIRRVRPARVFLRAMPETHYSTLQRLRHDFLSTAAGLLLLLGVALVASWLADSWKRGFGFIGGLAAAILILSVGAKLLLFVLRRIPQPSSLAFRHGLKNLYRPGNHVSSVMVALGIGVGFILTVYLIQTSLLAQIVKSAPINYPNVFLLGVTRQDQSSLWEFLNKQPGILQAGMPIPAIPARLKSVDGKTADQLNLQPLDRRYFQTEFVLSWTYEVPPETRIVEGVWWQAPYREPMISLGQSAARWLKIPVGSTLEFSSSGKTVRGRVVNIREIDFARPGNNNQFIFSPGTLDHLPASYVGALRVVPAQVAALQSALFTQYPNITSFDVGQILVRIQDLVDKIANIIRFIALFAILSGVVVLASSVVATRYQRIREAVLLKTLGATRAQVRRIHAAEFLIVGTAAGMIGCLLAAVAADLLLGYLLDTEFKFQWLPLAVGTLGTAVLAIVTGWLANRGVLNHRPLEVLREN